MKNDDAVRAGTPARRSFLKGMAAAGGVAAGGAAGTALAAPAPAEQPAADRQRGYQLTEHVASYYRTARI